MVNFEGQKKGGKKIQQKNANSTGAGAGQRAGQAGRGTSPTAHGAVGPMNSSQHSAMNFQPFIIHLTNMSVYDMPSTMLGAL